MRSALGEFQARTCHEIGDDLMVAVANRGYSVRLVRTVLESFVLVVGVALGGHVGVGTVAAAFVLSIRTHANCDEWKNDGAATLDVMTGFDATEGEPEFDCVTSTE